MVKLADKTRAERKAIARKAEQFLEQHQPRIQRLEQRYKDDWGKCEDSAERERLWNKHAALKDLVLDLAKEIGDGRVVEEIERRIEAGEIEDEEM